MLFNSPEFIFIFFPITITLFFIIGGRGHHRAAISWLVGSSLFYYGWWNPIYIGLILGSILFNYGIGVTLGNLQSQQNKRLKKPRMILTIGVLANLLLLGYYKYANFIVDNINLVSISNYHLRKIILPLAISFFTFQQIAYLVDAYRGKTREYNFLHYCLFVSFFPQLIAGPIVHHKEMLPQFAKNKIYKFNYNNCAIGSTMFFIGLFKKTVLADNLALMANPVFDHDFSTTFLSFNDCWLGALSYTFQLYFDFSGYSDMAIGIARIFGIRLPLNFNSPYKAKNIISFWRRWHITLSRFLRDYLYFSIGGNRNGKYRRHLNLLITMVLGGLWHGAGWTFIIWGALHGSYLIINHSYISVVKKIRRNGPYQPGLLKRTIYQFITFLAVVIGWVFFRAESYDTALLILQGMAGTAGFSGSDLTLENIILLSISFIIVWFLPNTQQFMSDYNPALVTYRGEIEKWRFKYFKFKLNYRYSVFLACLIMVCVLMMQSVQKSEFLYYDF